MNRGSEWPRMSRRAYLSAVSVGTAVALAGCNSSSEGDSSPEDGNESSPENESESSLENSSGEDDAEGSSDRIVDGSIADVPLFGYNQSRTGHVANRDGPTGEGEIYWSAELDGEIASAPVVVDETVFVGTNQGTGSTDGYRYAVDARDGSEEWAVEAGAVWESPTVEDGTVYFHDPNLKAVDAANGSELWEFNLQSTRSTPVAVGNTVLTGALYAVDATSGTEDWYTSFAPTDGSATYAVVDETIYVASERSIQALKLSDGTVNWTYDVGENGVTTGVAVADGTIYAGTGIAALQETPELHAVSADDGSEEWRVEAPGWIHNQVAVTPERIYYQLTREQTVIAADPADGSVQWKFEQGRGPNPGNMPVVIGDTVYAGLGSTVYGIGAESGDQRFSADIGETVNTPTVAGDVIYVTSTGGNLYALAE